MSAHRRYFLMGILLAAGVFAADQLSKWVILSQVISPPERAEVVLAPFASLVLVWNYGISFGLFAAHRQPLLLMAMSAAIVCVLLVWLFRNGSCLVAAALGLVIGGAAGNMVDRYRFGAVVDFLDFHLGDYHWPAFNVADSCIFIGVVLLCVSSMVLERHNNG